MMFFLSIFFVIDRLDLGRIIWPCSNAHIFLYWFSWHSSFIKKPVAI